MSATLHRRTDCHWDLPNLGVIDHPLGYGNLVFDRGKGPDGHAHTNGGEMAPGVFKDPVAKNPATSLQDDLQ